MLKGNGEKPADTEESKDDTVKVKGFSGPELEMPSEDYAAKIQQAIDSSRKKKLCKKYSNCEDQ